MKMCAQEVPMSTFSVFELLVALRSVGVGNIFGIIVTHFAPSLQELREGSSGVKNSKSSNIVELYLKLLLLLQGIRKYIVVGIFYAWKL